MKISGNFVIAGGANGIGNAIAREVSILGAKVYVIDKDEPKHPLENVSYTTVDLAVQSEVSELKDKLPVQIDGLILSIGVMRRGTILESTEADYDLLMDTNVKATWLVLKTLTPLIEKAGIVVQLSSGHVLDPEADPGIYTLSKKAVTSLVEILELTRPDLDVKYVYPGPVLTNLLLQGRSKEDKERIKKIAQEPAFIAKKTIELINSNNKSMKFDPKAWDYSYE